MKNPKHLHPTPNSPWPSGISLPSLTLLLLLAASSVTGMAAEAIVNGGFDTDRPIVLRGFASRQDFSSAFPRLLGTSTTGIGWYSIAGPNQHFEVWEPGFFGNPTSFGQHLELTDRGTVFQDFTLSDPADATFSFLYTRALSGSPQFSVSIGLPGLGGANDASLLAAVTINPSGSFSDWQTFSANLSAIPAGTYRVSFTDVTATTALDQPLIDQVSFAVVPEPSAAVLLALGLFGGGLLLRKRRKDEL